MKKIIWTACVLPLLLIFTFWGISLGGGKAICYN